MRYYALILVERAYRGGVEEQYNGVIYQIRGFRRQFAGPIAVVLRGAAVTFAIAGRSAVTRGTGRPPVARGGAGPEPVHTRPGYAADLRALLVEGGDVYAVTEDCRRLGVATAGLLAGVAPISAGELPALAERADRIFYF